MIQVAPLMIKGDPMDWQEDYHVQFPTWDPLSHLTHEKESSFRVLR